MRKFVVFATLLLDFASLSAATITVGANTTANAVPFGFVGLIGLSRYQQVYSSTAFSGPVTITAFTVAESDIGNNIVDTATYDIFFSTTPAPVNGLSTTVADNVGPDNHLFGTYTLSGNAGNSLVFNATTPFSYAPSSGNLLIDIQISNVTANPLENYFLQTDSTGSVTSRVLSCIGCAGGGATTPATIAEAVGFVTTFTVTPEAATPELPSSVPVLFPFIAVWIKKRFAAPVCR